MSKETFYFQHDFEPTSDPKIQAMIGVHGGLGYGLFWRMIEMLHSSKDHKLPKKRYIYLAIAQQMLANAQQIEAFINTCINDYELFVSDDDFFWSNRVLDNFKKREDISKKRSEAAKRANNQEDAKAAKALAMQMQANAMQIPTKKRKENIYKEIYKEIIDYLNSVSGKDFKATTNKTMEVLNARINDGYALEDFKKVIRVKCADWLNTKDEMYIRPETLFGNKFDGYKNQPENAHVSSNQIPKSLPANVMPGKLFKS